MRSDLVEVGSGLHYSQSTYKDLIPMDDQVIPSHHSTSESMVALTGDLASGRQLRKSCRFCRSRKIRCSGETNIGCSACRNRNQKCIYEPTAAMGRPRKYPRNELCSNANAPAPANLTSPAATPLFQRGWNDSRYFMRSMHPQSYGPCQVLPPAASPWRPLGDETTGTAFHAVSSVNTHRSRPAMPHMPSLPAPHHPQDLLPTRPHRGSSGAFLDRYTPVPDSGKSTLSSTPSHHGSTSQAGLQGSIHHPSFPSQRISPELNPIDHLSINSTEVTMAQSSTQSSPSILSNDNGNLGNIHHMISSCDLSILFQYFQGATLHTVTQAHLQFILREYPNPYLSAPHKHPGVLEPQLYHTMVSDLTSFITCPSKTTSHRQNGLPHKSELLFIQMLDYDRGENVFQESTAVMNDGNLAPLDQLSHEELGLIYSKWLRVNPFGFLFNDVAPGHQSTYYCEDRALLAAIVGWHFYLSLQRCNYDSVEIANMEQQKIPLRAYMPFFEYAEAELMGRTMRVNELTLATVRGLTLLAAFRSADSQPRCGWALMSVAHALTKEYLTTSGVPRSVARSKGEFDSQEGQMLGFHWLLNLYRCWTLLSMGFPKAKIYTVLDGSPSYLESHLPSVSFSNTGTPTNEAWANRTLLDASQILEVFCTVCREDPSTLLIQNTAMTPVGNDQVSERKIYLIRWLMDTAKMRCKVMGLYDSPPSNTTGEPYHPDHENQNSHSNIVLAVVYSLFALSRLMPSTSTQFTKIPMSAIRDVLLLLQIISFEGINPIVGGSSASSMPLANAVDEALMLGILRRIFRYMTIVLQAFANTLSDFSHTSASDYPHIVTQFLDVIESFESFATSGLSLHPVEDFQKFENLRITLGSPGSSFTVCPPTHSNRRQAGSLQARLPVSMVETAYDVFEPPQPTDQTNLEPFKIKEEYARAERQPIPINGHSEEANHLINSYSAPATASSTETASTCNREGNSAYLPTSTDVGCLSSSPLLSDRTLSVAQPIQKCSHSDPKVEHLIMTSQAPGFIFPISNTHGMIGASEIDGAEAKCGVYGCQRGGQGHYLCALDSSWIPQLPRHQIDVDSHPQPIHFDSFPRSSTFIHQVSPPAGSPPSYKDHSQSIDYFPRNTDLREASAGCFLPSDSPSRGFQAPVITDESSGIELGILGPRLNSSVASTPCPHAERNTF